MAGYTFTGWLILVLLLFGIGFILYLFFYNLIRIRKKSEEAVEILKQIKSNQFIK